MSRSGGILAPADGRRFVSGLYYCLDEASSDSTLAPVQDQLYLNAFTVGAAAAFNQISLEVTAAGAGSSIDLLLYDASAPGGMPGVKLVGANISGAATGIITAAIAVTLPPGVYWIGAVAHTATLPSVRSKNVAGTRWVGAPTGGNANATTFVLTGQAVQPGNNPAVVTAQSPTVPKVMLRAA